MPMAPAFPEATPDKVTISGNRKRNIACTGAPAPARAILQEMEARHLAGPGKRSARLLFEHAPTGMAYPAAVLAKAAFSRRCASP